ncbi:MAG: PEP-CTERM sorting domain-containing protein [Verrucomicrobiota bacterium]
MNQYTQRIAAAIAVLGGLTAAPALQAQTWSLADFQNFNLSATYANWDQDGSQIIYGGTGYTPTLSSGPSGFTVDAQGYGSGAYDFATPLNASGANEFRLTFTINTTMAHPDNTGLWLGPNLDISDGTHMVHMSGANAGGGWLNYGPYVGPGTYTIYGPLTDQFGGAPLDTSTITAFNLEFDPAEYGAGAPYSITYQSLELVATPEPTSAALLGLGGAALLALRRRKL